jgi:hypothetical protein
MRKIHSICIPLNFPLREYEIEEAVAIISYTEKFKSEQLFQNKEKSVSPQKSNLEKYL